MKKRQWVSQCLCSQLHGHNQIRHVETFRRPPAGCWGGGFINNTKYTKLKWAQAHFTLVVVAHLVLNKCNNKIFELFLLVPPSEWKSGAAVENTSKHETETNSVCERHSQLWVDKQNKIRCSVVPPSTNTYKDVTKIPTVGHITTK